MVDAALYQALNLVRQIRLSWKRGNAIDTIGRGKKAIAEYIKSVLAEEQIPFKSIGGWLKIIRHSWPLCSGKAAKDGSHRWLPSQFLFHLWSLIRSANALVSSPVCRIWHGKATTSPYGLRIQTMLLPFDTSIPTLVICNPPGFFL